MHAATFTQKFMSAIQRRLHSSAWLAIIIMATAQVLGIWWWQAELLTHFSFFGAIYLIIAGVFIKQNSRYIFWFVGGMLVTYGMLPISYWGQFNTSKPEKYKVLSYNVAINNPNPKTELNFILKINADVLLLAEAGGKNWQATLAAIKLQYPYGCGHDEASPFALQALSKRPLNSCSVGFVKDLPYIRAQTADNTILYAMHPPPPINAHLAKIRLDYFAKTAQLIQAEKLPVVVAGDLNSTAFSPIYRRFVKQANLRSLTFRALPTWKPFFLPIDHVLSSANSIRNVKARNLDWQFSDHVPMLFSW